MRVGYLFFAGLISANVEADVAILAPLSADGDNIATQIARQIPASHPRIFQNIKEIKASQYNLVIALGADAFTQACQAQNSSAVLATFLYRQDFVDSACSTHVSAIYADSDPAAQLALIHEIFQKTSIGFIYTPKTKFYFDDLQHLSNSYDINIVGGEVLQDDIFKTLRRILDNSNFQLLLLSPDNTLYNKNTFRPVLEMMLRQYKGTVGYSPKLVEAGSIGATYFSEAVIINETVNAVQYYQEKHRLPASTYPRDVTVKVNAHYLHAVFNITPPDERVIEAHINEQRRKKP